MNIEISPEQKLLMIHALDLAIADIREQLRRAIPKNVILGQRFKFNEPFAPAEQRFVLLDEYDKDVVRIPRKAAKLISRGILERLQEYEGLRSDLLKLSETPSVRAYTNSEQDELR
jgi:hypothetical protein